MCRTNRQVPRVESRPRILRQRVITQKKKVHIVSPSSPVIGFSHFNEPGPPAGVTASISNEQWKSINLIWHFLKRRPTVFCADLAHSRPHCLSPSCNCNFIIMPDKTSHILFFNDLGVFESHVFINWYTRMGLHVLRVFTLASFQSSALITQLNFTTSIMS